MSQIAYFNLPDVGEGLTEAEIVSWKIAEGDSVSVNQIIVEIETAKSLVELPVPEKKSKIIIASISNPIFFHQRDPWLVDQHQVPTLVRTLLIHPRTRK